MMVRDSIRDGNLVVGHLLAGVMSVFIDEAHLFENTARGDQISWLLARLRRITQLSEGKQEPNGCLHICAGSATIGEPNALASRLLGAGASAVVASSHRKITFFDNNGAWVSLEPSLCTTVLRELLPLAADSLEVHVEERVWEALASLDDGERMRKALVFVPSRQLCDLVSARLTQVLPKRRQIKVLAHHGSLAKEVREQAEHAFMGTRDAVLVATTTLEVGIDIGDVDFVVQVGAPSGTRSLLQRIGRGGRKSGVTRVLSIPRSRMEALAVASMLLDGRDGKLEPEHHARRWSVFVQQAASFVAQAGLQGRRRSDVIELVQDVWADEDSASLSLDRLIESGHFREDRGRLLLDGEWADLFAPGALGMHANFSAAGGVPVVDGASGEVLAYVGSWSTAGSDVPLGGRRWDVERTDEAFIVKPKDAEGLIETGFRYAARRAPTGRWFASHVRRGLGLSDRDAPTLATPEWGEIWLHFGGTAYEALILRLFSEFRAIGELSGLAIQGIPDVPAIRNLSLHKVRTVVEAGALELETFLELGVHQADLPDQVRRDVVAKVVGVAKFHQWLLARRMRRIVRGDPLWTGISALL